MENVNAAKSVLTSPIRVGNFSLAKALDASVDRSVSVRGSNTLNAPNGKTFSGYLRDVLVAELRAAGKLDDNAQISISGELTQSELNAGMSTGDGRLGAHFTVTRSTSVCLDKELVATGEWESSFIAAVAVPAAFNGYQALFPKLAGKLLQDPEFKQHCLNAN